MCFRRSLPAASVRGPRGEAEHFSIISECALIPLSSLRMLKSSHRMKKLLEERWYCIDLVSSLLYLFYHPPPTPTKVILTAKWRPNSILEALTMPQCSLSGLTMSGADKNAQIFKSFQLWVSIPAFVPCPFPHPIHSASSQYIFIGYLTVHQTHAETKRET